MKRTRLFLALAWLASMASAEKDPTLVFAGYIDYPDRHDYRIEVFTDSSGLISRVATYSGQPMAISEEMNITRGENSISGIDRFQQNIKTFKMIKQADSIHIIVTNENVKSRATNQKTGIIRIRPQKVVLFEDDERRFMHLSTGVFRIESRTNKEDAIIIRENQIFDDGWYRSDWRRVGDRTIVNEFTTMETPGDWITDGGGVFTGNTLSSSDLAINIMNYYILEIYADRRIFIPFIFGLKTGSY